MRKSTLIRTVEYAASRRLTLLAMLGLGTGVLISYGNSGISSNWIALPLVVLGINLLAVILTSRHFNRQYPLLVFHLGLLAIILLAALGQMGFMQGRLELTEGQEFDPAAVMIVQQGPWHRFDLPRGLFVQGPIQVEYGPGLRRRSTRSEILLPGDTNRVLQLGDGSTFSNGGYRFLPTFNKGYAVVFSWQGGNGETRYGSVHLPSYPELEWNQENEWRTPAGEILRLELRPAGPADREKSWILNSAAVQDPKVIIRARETTAELRPGQTLKLAAGVLRFEGIRMWMGYRVDYNPALGGLLLAALISIAALGLHFWKKYAPSAFAVDPAEQPLGGLSHHV